MSSRPPSLHAAHLGAERGASTTPEMKICMSRVAYQGTQCKSRVVGTFLSTPFRKQGPLKSNVIPLHVPEIKHIFPLTGRGGFDKGGCGWGRVHDISHDDTTKVRSILFSPNSCDSTRPCPIVWIKIASISPYSLALPPCG